MTDTINDMVYNGTFGLTYEDGECILGINAIDFFIQQTNGSLSDWKGKFETQIQLLTKGLKGFGKDVGSTINL
ncbi:hypothetical protein D3C79_1073930 [compost metagenome]